MDDQQRTALARRTYEWIHAVKRLKDSGALIEEDPVTKHAETVESLHFLLISLEQISKFLKHLPADTSVPFHGQRQRFLDVWDAPLEASDSEGRGILLSDARDALEHEAEYIAGNGTFPHLIGDGWRNLNYQGGFSWTKPGGINTMSILGRHYMLAEVISAALDLEEPVAQWLEEKLGRPPNP